ncbi:hypothetical protein E2C01_086290 [Portunus trituberculatus]|uniref:Uncharacterized protein n=1 Tax=Portunus trituberculatus TaxID=210409 RepID=A0A5B7JB43_PORTR|nr:hypothetical protein [Portunus trituberculatus]
MERPLAGLIYNTVMHMSVSSTSGHCVRLPCGSPPPQRGHTRPEGRSTTLHMLNVWTHSSVSSSITS